MSSALHAVQRRPHILALSALIVLAQCKASPTSSAPPEPAPEAAVVPASPPPVVSASASPASSGLVLETPLVRMVPPLREAMAALSRKIAELGGDLGAALLDITSGELLAVHSDRRPLNPASNAKLFTAATALSVLHGNYRFETGLYGEQKGSSVSRLVLRGHGDPSFATSDLWAMAQDLRTAGVQRIEGDILVDQRFFDDGYVPPAFEQQPNEWASFRAPVSAVALNQNTITMTVRPGGVGAPALVSFDPPGMVEVQGTVDTAAAGLAENIKLDLAPNGYRLLARVGGALAQDERPISFSRRVDNPTLLAGYALKALLSAAGIASPGDVKPGGEQQKRLLVLHRSAPLASLLDELGKASDNFYAEMVLKAIGAEKGRTPRKKRDGR